MEKRYLALLAAVVVAAGLAVVGTIGGEYLADRTASRSTGPTGGVTSDAQRTSTGSGESDPAPPPSPGTATPPSPEPAGDEPTDRTYRIDRLLYEQGPLTVTLVSAEATDGRLRLNLVYRNGSATPWPVSCPTAEVDLVSSKIELADGRTVRPETSWCATTRAGESFSIAAGRAVDTWAVYPAVPATGQPFALTWYDFPTAEDIRLR
ncbi:hypothetical protein [Micromonospora fluostatini]|uniref:hypothetical protein n=1 Tax=Micromonospora sp. JCM 30529 TaxID=3421643 RepID=UPI003D17495C